MINLNKKFFLIILIMSSASAFANTVEQAIEAEKNNEDNEATEIWNTLASKGNTIAKYNLAKNYQAGKGVTKDPAQAKKWYRQATRSGLTEAYASLNKNAIKPANGIHLTFKSGPLYWLKEQKPQLYTLQLASSRYEKNIVKLYDENFLKGKGGYFRYQRDGVDRYALVYGTYNTVAEAKGSIKDLPTGLKNRTPWVRRIKTLQKISK